MNKNKGSFWKKNIKKNKKERKQRGIKQETKRKESRIKTEAIRKATEETERKEEEVKRIRETEEEKRKEIQGTYEAEQEPENYCNLLLDANIFYDILSDNEDVESSLRNYLDKKPLWGGKLAFLTLDRIITEFINMAKYRHAKYYEYDDVVECLSRLGESHVVRLDHNSEFAYRARQLCESEKYKSVTDGKPLSEADCYLLEYTIEHECKLVTHDRTLYDATSEEIRLRADENELAGVTSAGVFDPHRTWE